MPSPLDIPLRRAGNRRGQDAQPPVTVRTPMGATLHRDGAQAQPLEPPLHCPGEVGTLRIAQ
eukprot:10863570-Lingulodinium_polyedra.AAC.1